MGKGIWRPLRPWSHHNSNLLYYVLCNSLCVWPDFSLLFLFAFTSSLNSISLSLSPFYPLSLAWILIHILRQTDLCCLFSRESFLRDVFSGRKSRTTYMQGTFIFLFTLTTLSFLMSPMCMQWWSSLCRQWCDVLIPSSKTGIWKKESELLDKVRRFFASSISCSAFTADLSDKIYVWLWLENCSLSFCLHLKVFLFIIIFLSLLF